MKNPDNNVEPGKVYKNHGIHKRKINFYFKLWPNYEWI